MIKEIVETKVIQDTLYALMNGYKLIVHQGGTYSGKTVGILLALQYYFIQNPHAKIKSRIVGQSVPELKGGALKDMIEINDVQPMADILSKQDNIYKIGSNTMRFQSIDTIGKSKSGKWKLTYINEANHIDWSIAENLILKSDIVIIDFNPDGRFWFHKYILPDIDKYKPYLLKRTTYKDNPTLPQSTIDKIKNIKGPNRDSLVHGKLASNPAAVYKDWSTFSGDMPLGSYHMYHLDFGFTNDVTALGEVCMYGGEVYCKEWIYETGLLTKHLNDKMVQLGIRKDIPIIADNIPKDIAELQVYGWKIIPAIKPKVVQRVSLMQEYIYKVHTASENYQSEFEDYKFLKNRSTGEYTNIPEDANNHLLDGLGYWGWFNLRKKNSILGKSFGSFNRI
jgi:phage terminase large subunit